MTELATAYISVVAETSGIPRQIRTALGQAQRDADSAGRNTGRSFASSFGSSLKGLGAVAGVTGGITAVGAAVKSAISSGMDFTTSLNTMQAVAGATSSQVAKVADVARQLGTDNSLAATSSVDAAQAMVELAKGGFSVEQSMAAARGTLQLAAAAQISAADAATIQSQALQAFGKDASFAGTAADILANAANQSSAEITDVAQALQQGGAVANQFGLSMQDSAATVALLANAGIKGSDAGTLLKSALLALTDQSKPAQGAMKELGVSAYDAEGKFVGMEALFGQLQTASKRMTPEMYQAATATLFGSDAARLAGVAAQQGAGGFDKLRDAMGQQGAAAAVASAKMQGLPGAWERVKNAAQDAGLAFYDTVKGPLTSAANWAAEAIGKIVNGASTLGPKLQDAFATVSGAFQSAGGMDMIANWGDRLMGVFESLWSSAKSLLPVVGNLTEMFAQASAVVSVVGIDTFVSALEAASQILSVAVVPLLQLTNSVLTDMQPIVVAALAAWLGFKAVGPALAGLRTQMTSLTTRTAGATGAIREFAQQNTALSSSSTTSQARMMALAGVAQASNGRFQTLTGQFISNADAQRRMTEAARTALPAMGRFGTAIGQIGQNLPAVARMQQSFVTAATGADRFGRTAGIAAAAGSGLRTAGSSIAGVFGGPVGLAMTGAAVGIGIFASSSAQAKSAQQNLEQAIKGTADAQVQLNEALFASRGAVDDNVMGLAAKRVSAVGDEYDAIEKKRQGFMGALGDASTWKQAITFGSSDSNYDKTNAAADAAQRAQSALDGLQMSDEALARSVVGNQGAFEAIRSRLIAAGDGGRDAASKLAEVRNSFLTTQEVARRTTPGFTELQTAMQKFSDSTASATDKSNALKNALDALNPARTKQAAVAQFNDTIRQVADTTAEAADRTQGFGRALLDVGGSINSTTQNGSTLQKSLLSIVDATAGAASAGADMNDVNAKNQQAFKRLADQYGLSIGDIRQAANTLGLTDISLVVGLKGANETVQGLGAVQAELSKLPSNGQPKVVEVQSGQLTEQTRTALQQLGFGLQEIDRNGVKTVRITANDLASGALNAVLAKLTQTGMTTADPQIVLRDAQFQLTNDGARKQLADLSTQVANPQAKLIIDQLTQGKTISMDQLKQLDQTIADPKVRLEVAKVLADIGLVSKGLDDAARARDATITVKTVDQVQQQIIAANPGAAAAFTRRADGGKIVGPGGPRDDQVLMLGSNGEWVHQAKAVNYYGPKFMDDVNNMRLPRRATGGPVTAKSLTDLAYGRSDGASSSLEGARYNWSGINWGDCSAAMSAFARKAAGLLPFGGRFSTASEGSQLQQMGAIMGRGEPGTLRFGWVNGGPGGGHTSGTLPDGTKVEMGGARGNGQIGGGAAGADDPQFTDHAYMKVAADVTTPTGAAPAVTSDVGTDSSFQSASSSGGSAGTSLSTRLGSAIGSFFEGQLSSLLSTLSINDSPGALAAVAEYENQVRSSKSSGSSSTTSKTSYENATAEKTRQYESDKLKRQQAYEAERDKLQNQLKGTKDAGRRAEIEGKLAEIKRAYQDANLAAKQKRDQERLSSRQQMRGATSDPGTSRPRPGSDLGKVFDRGGIANGTGLMQKNIIAPERTLSPRETSAFEDMVRRDFQGGGTSGLEAKLDQLIEVMSVAPRGGATYQFSDERGLRMAERTERRRVATGLAGK